MQALALAALFVLPDVTKEDVKKLLEAGMGERTIMTYIERNRPAAKLSADDVVELKKVGATDKVIEALLAAASAPRAEVRREVAVVQPRYYVYDPYPFSYYSWHYPRYSYPYYAYPYSYSRPHAHSSVYRGSEPRSFRNYAKPKN